MKLIRQRTDSDCGVAAYAMLTDRDYEISHSVLAAELGRDPEGLGDIPDHTIKILLQRDGWFCREIWRREETGGIWPPPPFADRHLALVTQPATGNGHYVVMDFDGAVLDPLRDDPCLLDEWAICSYVLGLRR